MGTILVCRVRGYQYRVLRIVAATRLIFCSDLRQSFGADASTQVYLVAFHASSVYDIAIRTRFKYEEVHYRRYNCQFDIPHARTLDHSCFLERQICQFFIRTIVCARCVGRVVKWYLCLLRFLPPPMPGPTGTLCLHHFILQPQAGGDSG